MTGLVQTMSGFIRALPLFTICSFLFWQSLLLIFSGAVLPEWVSDRARMMIFLVSVLGDFWFVGWLAKKAETAVLIYDGAALLASILFTAWVVIAVKPYLHDFSRERRSAIIIGCAVGLGWLLAWRCAALLAELLHFFAVRTHPPHS